MAKLNTVKQARKDQGKCSVCGKEIKAGDPYKWVKPQYRSKIIACPACRIKESRLHSGRVAQLLEIGESLEDILAGDIESIADGLRDTANDVKQIAEECQEACDNQREYFPDAEQAQENEDKATSLNEWADELESAADEIDSMLSEIQELTDEQDKLRLRLDELKDFTEKKQLTEAEETEKEAIEGQIDELQENIDSKETAITDKANEVSECPV